MARLLGKPFMPWQRYVADVALEVDPITGHLAYDEIVLTVPRQSGKSTFILAKAVHRASATDFFGPRQRLVYTAQTRNKAREKWEEDYAAELETSKAFRNRVTVHKGNGNEHIRFANRSRFGIEANTEKAGHGSVLDEAYIDEAFSQVDNRLEQAFSPAMITRANKQALVVSTAGWLDGSPFLLDKVTRGREQVDMGIREGMAHFEWSAPEDADPEDPATWQDCMPALGHTITEKAIAAEFRKMKLNDFRRAYLNQWVMKDDPGTETAVDMGAWVNLEGIEETRPTPVAFSVEVSEDRRWASIGLAGLRSDGRTHVQIVQAGRGTGWVARRVAELVHEWKPVAVAVRPSGKAGSLIASIEAEMPKGRDAVKVMRVGTSEYAQSCGLFMDAVTGGGLRHAGDRQVAVALGAARTRRTGDAEMLEPSDPTIDISPLRAITLAMYGLERGRATVKKRTGNVW